MAVKAINGAFVSALSPPIFENAVLKSLPLNVNKIMLIKRILCIMLITTLTSPQCSVLRRLPLTLYSSSRMEWCIYYTMAASPHTQVT